jgi:hypothetical protein
MSNSYYLIVREPGRKLVAVEGTGADRGIFWQIEDAENTAILLSMQNPRFEYHIYRVESSNDVIKGVVARYGDGSRK